MRCAHPIVAAVFLAVVRTEAASTWYVNACVGPGGDGTSPATAFCKIQDGVSAAAAGDTVRVLPGTYRECVDASIGGIVLLADDYDKNGRRDTTILDGTGICNLAANPLPTVMIGDGGTLEGFTVTGGGLSGVAGFGAVVITKNVVQGNRATSTATQYGLGGGIYLHASSFYAAPTVARVEDNVVRNNAADVDGGGIYVLGGITETASRQVRLEGNQVSGNTSVAAGGGIAVKTSTAAGSQIEVVITTNTIEGNGATGASGNFSYGGGVWASTYGSGSETIRIEGNTIRLNTAYYSGGGLSASIQESQVGSHLISVQGNDLGANLAGSYGGGMDLRISATDVPPASAPVFTAAGNSISGNSAAFAGGGAFLWASADASSGTTPVDSELKFTNNLVASNDAANTAGNAAGGGVALSLTARGQAVATIDLGLDTMAANGTDVGGGGIDIAVDTRFDTSSTHEGLASVVVEGSIVSSNLGYGFGKAPPPTGSTDNWQASIGYSDVFGNQIAPYESTVGTPPADSHNLEVDPLLDASFVPSVCSPTIDAADPADDFSQEPQPNGGRANQGHLGGTGSAVTSLPDTSGDRLVDGVDVLRIASAFASTAAGPRFYAPADLDRNGVVDGNDLAYVAARFGTDCR